MSAVDLQGAKAPRRTNRRDRRQPVVLPVKRDFRSNVDVRQPVAVGEAEGFVVAEIVVVRLGLGLILDPPIDLARCGDPARRNMRMPLC